MRTPIIGLALLGVLALACGGTTTTTQDLATPDLATASTADMATPDLATAGPQTVTVNVAAGGGFSFDPKTVTIKVGDTVKWVWGGGGHNVVSGSNATADNKFCSPNDMNCSAAALSNAGDTYSHKFTAAGSFPYFCRPHAGAGMTGTITVQ